MDKKVILTIDPGSPKKRDKEATTGVFVGEYFFPMKLESKSFVIRTSDKDRDETKCVKGIVKLVKKYEDMGYIVDVVIEEYINYGFNMAANSFSKNDTSELIGKIKYALDNKITEQATSPIKTKYNNNILINLGILEKKGNKYFYTEEFGGGASNRHERDACRHYLLRRDRLGMFNYITYSLDNLL